MPEETYLIPTPSGRSFIVASKRLNLYISAIKNVYCDERLYEERLLKKIIQEIDANPRIFVLDEFQNTEELYRTKSFAIIISTYLSIYLPRLISPSTNCHGYNVFHQIFLSDEIIQVLSGLAENSFYPSWSFEHDHPYLYDPTTIKGQLANFMLALNYDNLLSG